MGTLGIGRCHLLHFWLSRAVIDAALQGAEDVENSKKYGSPGSQVLSSCVPFLPYQALTRRIGMTKCPE